MWLAPHATTRTVGSPSSSSGSCCTTVASEKPSAPPASLYVPHEQTRPPTQSAVVTESPHATAATRCVASAPPDTTIGTSSSPARPSAPSSLQPQVKSSPAAPTAAECMPPHAMLTMRLPSKNGHRRGFIASRRSEPKPSWPQSPLPTTATVVGPSGASAGVGARTPSAYREPLSVSTACSVRLATTLVVTDSPSRKAVEP